MSGPVDHTWLGAGPTLLPAPEATASAGRSASSSAGRTTVLPKIVLEGHLPRLVHEEKPRYRALSVLGEGGMGRVELATDEDIQRRVAIKRLRPELRATSAVARFVQEIRVVGALDHPNIVPVHDVGRDDEGYYFVMKHLEGETLEAVIQRLASGDRRTHADWPLERRIAVFRALLQALAYAHQQGVVHRDIKPANVMIGRFGEVVLMDWGVARDRRQAELPADGESRPEASASLLTTRAGQQLGTPLYFSPEQARGDLELDPRSDLYSACLLFYELLSLHQPFRGLPTVEDISRAVQTRAASSWLAGPVRDAVPIEYLYIIQRGCALDPAERYPDVAALLADVALAEAGQFQVRCPLTFTKRMSRETSRWVDRRPWLAFYTLVAAALGLGAVLLAAGGAVALSVLVAAISLLS